MKTLIVEDDFASRLLLVELLKTQGPVHIAVNGKEAVEAVRCSLEAAEPYDLICLDIMLPAMDGQVALREIRMFEQARKVISDSGAKIVMTTARDEIKSVFDAFDGLCDSYLT